MDYLKFLKKYALEKGCRFVQLDEDTYKMISKNGLLRVLFRIHLDYLEAWGAFVELAEKIGVNELEQLLNDALNNNKCVYGLDNNFKFIDAIDLNINDKIEIGKNDKKIKYVLEVGFFTDANFYEVHGNNLQQIDFPKIDNEINNKISNLLRKNKIEFKTEPYKLYEMETLDSIIVYKGDIYFRIYANFWHNVICVHKESSKLDFSIHEERFFPLNLFTLEEIVEIIKNMK